MTEANMIEVSDDEFRRAEQRGLLRRTGMPIPTHVWFDPETERTTVDFANGASFAVPTRSLQGLETATADQLSDVELLGETGLHWESLDMDYTIAGLMNGIFGSKAFMDARRRGGQSRSEAKTSASRANGAKGGRPKKAVVSS